MSSPSGMLRIGSKIISQEKIIYTVDEILSLRSRGLSQQEVARRLKLERTFVSRLEAIGEIRKGTSLAVVGFPIKNKEEIDDLCKGKGIDYIWLMNNRERWDFLRDRNTLDFFNLAVEVIAQLKQFDILILLTSERWHKVAHAFLDNQIVFLEIGRSPVQEDCRVDPERFLAVLRDLGF